MLTKTIDIQEEANEILDGEVAELEQAANELVERLEGQYESYSEVPKEDRQAYDEIEAERVERRGEAKALIRACIEWSSKHELEQIEDDPDDDVLNHRHDEFGDTEFEIKELSLGGLGAIQDEVSEKSFSMDRETGEMEGTPKQGYGMIEVLRRSITKQPQGAPTRRDRKGREIPEPGEYPHQVGLYLFEIINNFNTTGDTDMGNSSLRSRMSSNSSQENSSTAE